MTQHAVRQWIGRVGLVAGTGLVLVGCPEDAIDITEPASLPSFDFSVASSFVPPTGSFAVERLTLAEFDTTVTEAFGRATGALGFFNADNAFGYPAYGLAGLARNGSTDPRLPALADDDAAIGAFCVLGSPPFPGLGEGFWDLYCQVTNLNPNTRYTVMMVRYGLTVNGELDAAAVALGETVSDPDDLTVLGGTPGGAPTAECNFSVAVPVARDVNPFVLGFVDTDTDGNTTIDCVPYSTAADATWWRNFDSPLPDGVEDSIPFGPNTGADGIDLSIPSYNYLVLVEGEGTPGDPVPTGPHAMRWQVGNDIDLSGNPSINNALAPFPLPLSTAELVAAPGGAGRPDSISVIFNQLEALAGAAVYEAWLVNPETGSMVPAVGTYNRIKILAERDPITGDIIATRDSVVETVASTNSFAGGDEEDGYRHEIMISDNSLAAGDTVGFHTHLALTVTSSPGGSAPSDARPFWFQFTDQNGTPDNFFDDSFNNTGTTSFGNFDVDEPALSLIYGGDGGGRGGFRGDVLSVNLESLSRPPIGYSYVGWLVREDGTAFRLPDITGPPPDRVSLVDADVDAIAGLITPTGILEANLRVVADEAGIEFSEFRTLLLTLEAKAGAAALGSIATHVGSVPDRVINPPDGGD